MKWKLFLLFLIHLLGCVIFTLVGYNLGFFWPVFFVIYILTFPIVTGLFFVIRMIYRIAKQSVKRSTVIDGVIAIAILLVYITTGLHAIEIPSSAGMASVVLGAVGLWVGYGIDVYLQKNAKHKQE